MATDTYKIENNSEFAYDTFRDSSVRVDELISRKFVGIDVFVDAYWVDREAKEKSDIIVTLELEEA